MLQDGYLGQVVCKEKRVPQEAVMLASQELTLPGGGLCWSPLLYRGQEGIILRKPQDCVCVCLPPPAHGAVLGARGS